MMMKQIMTTMTTSQECSTTTARQSQECNTANKPQDCDTIMAISKAIIANRRKRQIQKHKHQN